VGNWRGKLGVVEFATSGTNPDTERIVAARVAVLDEAGVELVRWDWGSDRADAIVGEVSQTLRTLWAVGTPVATYEAAAGLTMLDRECRRRYLDPLDGPSPVLDPLLLDHLLEPDFGGSRTLNAMAERYGVAPGSLAAGRLVLAMASRLDGSPVELHERQRELVEFWPVVPLDDIRLIEDTRPHPAPSPRPSETVPMFDFGGLAGRELEPAATRPGGRPELATSPPLGPPEVAERRPAVPEASVPPAKPRRIHVAAGIVTDPAGRAVVVRKRGTTGFMQPGGKIERGESALATLVRELREELGIEVVVEDTEFLGSFEAPALNEPGQTVRAEVFALRTDATLRAGNEIEELYWLESPSDVNSVELAPLTLEVLLPLWAARRPALF
jgi:8-oxo-dGTP pyrophosphatase MutT (NUDIX family)